MNTPRMKEAWESSSKTADGFYSTTTPMSVHAKSCYEEGCKLENELTTVTAQRDRLAKACDQYSEDEILCKLQTVTAQRDRLAEALKEIYNVSSFDYATMPEPALKKYREVVLEMADEALQSLTQNAEL
jgi:hypothetical protein